MGGRLVNELDKIKQTFVLVIDDYHLVRTAAIHELVENILMHPPHAMHLVLACRQDPSLPLSKLRATGQMTEIRVKDLRFSNRETEEFLRRMLDMTFDESIVASLEKKTEGWITGLHLAALSLRNKDDLDRVMTGLQDDGFVMDYFVDEIFSQQPPAIQQQLSLFTGGLTCLCVPLHARATGAKMPLPARLCPVSWHRPYWREMTSTQSRKGLSSTTLYICN